MSIDGYFPFGDYGLTISDWMKSNKSALSPQANTLSDKAEALFA